MTTKAKVRTTIAYNNNTYTHTLLVNNEQLKRYTSMTKDELYTDMAKGFQPGTVIINVSIEQ